MTTGANPLLRPEERAFLTEILCGWGAAPELVEDTIRDAVFGPGVAGVEAQAGKPNHDLAIMVDDERDAELGRPFDLGRDLDDETFVARWGIDAPARIGVLASPSAPEAVCAYTIEIARPVALRRTFILLAQSRRGSCRGCRSLAPESGSHRRRSAWKPGPWKG